MKDKTTLISVIGVIAIAIAITVIERKNPDLSSNEQRYKASLIMNAHAANTSSITATVAYGIPQGYSEDMTVTLSILNNTITDVSIQYGIGVNHESVWYQNRFQSAYRPLVIGKNIDSISLSRVGGASLTTNAFNAALHAIKEQAA